MFFNIDQVKILSYDEIGSYFGGNMFEKIYVKKVSGLKLVSMLLTCVTYSYSATQIISEDDRRLIDRGLMNDVANLNIGQIAEKAGLKDDKKAINVIDREREDGLRNIANDLISGSGVDFRIPYNADGSIRLSAKILSIHDALKPAYGLDAGVSDVERIFGNNEDLHSVIQSLQNRWSHDFATISDNALGMMRTAMKDKHSVLGKVCQAAVESEVAETKDFKSMKARGNKIIPGSSAEKIKKFLSGEGYMTPALYNLITTLAFVHNPEGRSSDGLLPDVFSDRVMDLVVEKINESGKLFVNAKDEGKMNAVRYTKLGFSEDLAKVLEEELPNVVIPTLVEMDVDGELKEGGIVLVGPDIFAYLSGLNPLISEVIGKDGAPLVNFGNVQLSEFPNWNYQNPVEDASKVNPLDTNGMVYSNDTKHSPYSTANGRDEVKLTWRSPINGKEYEVVMPKSIELALDAKLAQASDIVVFDDVDRNSSVEAITRGKYDVQNVPYALLTTSFGKFPDNSTNPQMIRQDVVYNSVLGLRMGPDAKVPDGRVTMISVMDGGKNRDAILDLMQVYNQFFPAGFRMSKGGKLSSAVPDQNPNINVSEKNKFKLVRVN